MYVTAGLNDPGRGWTVPLFASLPGTKANAIFWLDEVNTGQLSFIFVNIKKHYTFFCNFNVYFKLFR